MIGRSRGSHWVVRSRCDEGCGVPDWSSITVPEAGSTTRARVPAGMAAAHRLRMASSGVSMWITPTIAPAAITRAEVEVTQLRLSGET